jgi:transcriptional regulator GlxA family with amidase domain
MQPPNATSSEDNSRPRSAKSLVRTPRPVSAFTKFSAKKNSALPASTQGVMTNAGGAEPGMTPMVKEKRLCKVLASIESHSPHSVRELALEVHLGPDHLQRLFKRETGVHLGGLLFDQRLRWAAQLLSTSNLEIKEIAHLVGYRHHSSFVRAFQRRFTQSPRQYRQQSAS